MPYNRKQICILQSADAARHANVWHARQVAAESTLLSCVPMHTRQDSSPHL